MPQNPLRLALSAAPPYLGGKRELLSWTFGHLAQALPASEWSSLVFADAFLGGGSVSMYLKAQGPKALLVNDISNQSQWVAEGLLCNQSIRLDRSDLFFLTQSVPDGASPGLVESEYASSCFSLRHAKALDQWCYWKDRFHNPTKKALATLAIWHSIYDFTCFPTSLGSSNKPFAEALDGKRSWSRINPKRFTDGSIQSLLKPTLTVLEEKRLKVNRGVFGGTPVSRYQLDACEFLEQIQADVVYLDPPYAGTTEYSKAYGLLESILTGRPAQRRPSRFSSDLEALDSLLEAAQHIPCWILAFGNKVIDLDGLLALVRRHARGRKVQGFAKNYVHMPHVAKRSDNQELIILAVP